MNQDGDAFAAAIAAGIPSGRIGACELGGACTAPNQELSEQYRCRYCNKQLHGFISACSQAKNPNDFRDGVICRDQPCIPGDSAVAAVSTNAAVNSTSTSTSFQTRADGAAIAAAAGLPEFLWDTQQSKRKRDPNAPKLRRQRYTKEQKATVLEALHNTPGAKLPDIAKQFNIPEGTVRGWYDDERRQKAMTGVVEMSDLNDAMLGDAANEDGLEGGVAAGGSEAAAEEGDPDRPKKKRRQRYSNETKIQVILALETRPNASLNEVAKEFNVAPGTVRGWREEADKIQQQAMENRRVGAKANPSKDPLRRIWNAILSLFEKNSRLPEEQRLEVNVAVVRTIGRQARDILLEAHAKEPFLPETEVQHMKKFKASETWARKWARDHQVMSAKPETGTKAEIAQAKLLFLQKVVAEYPPERVYTMTPTALFYRILPHRTYVSKMPDGSRIRACKGLKSKDLMTLYFCTNESGTDKLPITCIGKYERPACFQVDAQKNLPYLSQKQGLSDAGTFQQWWRTVFLPHIRNQSIDGNEKCLLLIEDMGSCKAELLKDPTGQVQVEALPPSLSSTVAYNNVVPKDKMNGMGGGLQSGGPPGILGNPNAPPLPQCQALEYGILETVKRRYRYRLLQEVMEAFDERAMRRKVADNADFPIGSRGLREGCRAHVADAMRLLESIWAEVASTTISKAWQRTKLRIKAKDDAPTLPPGQRAKSEKRQTTREKKQLVKDLTHFLGKHESKNFIQDDGSNELEEMVEKLKNCFLYTDGEVIDTKDMMESLEEWISLEDSQGMVSLFMEEIKQEMNIDYLVGLKEPIEGVVPEADEGEDETVDPPPSDDDNNNGNIKPGKEALPELDLETAMELASTIKSTACKLLNHGDILGELAVRLDDAADSVFRLLRKQKEMAEAKKEAEKAKELAKNKAKAREEAALAVAEAVAAAATTGGGVGNPTMASQQEPHDEGIVDPDTSSVDLAAADVEMTGI